MLIMIAKVKINSFVSEIKIYAWFRKEMNLTIIEARDMCKLKEFDFNGNSDKAYEFYNFLFYTCFCSARLIIDVEFDGTGFIGSSGIVLNQQEELDAFEKEMKQEKL